MNIGCISCWKFSVVEGYFDTILGKNCVCFYFMNRVRIRVKVKVLFVRVMI